MMGLTIYFAIMNYDIIPIIDYCGSQGPGPAL